MANQHCGQHDKIFNPDLGQSCPGCQTEFDDQTAKLAEGEPEGEPETKKKSADENDEETKD